MGKEVAIASERIYEGRLMWLWVDAVYLSERMMSRRELQEEWGYIIWSASGVRDDRWWGDLRPSSVASFMG